MWHLHKWEVVDRETYPSAFEQMTAAGVSELSSVPSWMFVRHVIIVRKCQKCGAMKVVRV